MDNGNWVLLTGLTAAVAAGLYVFWGPERKKSLLKGQVPGLVNLGNTCFLNAVLQAMAACPSIVHWFSVITHKFENFSPKESNANLCHALKGTLKVLNNQVRWNSDEHSPVDVIRALQAHHWVISTEEQDAHEMFHVLSSTVEEEVASQSPTFSLSDIKELDKIKVPANGGIHKLSSSTQFQFFPDFPFKGLLASQLMCRTCRHKYPLKYDTFDSLSLTIPPAAYQEPDVSLQFCLRHFVMSEIVPNVECENCSQKGGKEVHRTFLKKLSIGKLPKCLCIHLQRMVWLENGMPMKCFDHVTYPEVLCMDDFLYQNDSCQPLTFLPKNLVGGNSTVTHESASGSPVQFTKISSSTASESTQPERPKLAKHCYQLQAVIVHLGDVFSGHFVTYRRGPVNTRYHNSWFFTSDTIIREKTLKEVMEAPAYVLFYEKIPAITTQSMNAGDSNLKATSLTSTVARQLDSLL